MAMFAWTALPEKRPGNTGGASLEENGKSDDQDFVRSNIQSYSLWT